MGPGSAGIFGYNDEQVGYVRKHTFLGDENDEKAENIRSN